MRQNRKNRTVVNRFDLGRVPVTSVDVAKPETAQQFRERLAKEEEARINAPIKAAERQLTETLRQMTEELAQTWRLPLDKLQRFDRNYADALYVELSLPKENPDADPEVVSQSVKAEFKAFIENLPSRGWVFNNSVRFQTFIQTQIIFGDAKVDQSSLQKMFDWLVQGQCFTETELRYIPELVPPEPQSQTEPTRMSLKDALLVADGSRESEALLRTAATNDFIFGEAKPMIDQFIEFLYREYDYIPTEQQRLELFLPPNGYFHVHGLSFLDPRSYDRARRWAVATGRFRPDMISASEACDDLLRKGLIPFARYQYLEMDLQRRGLWNRSRRHADALGLIPKV